MRYPPFIGLFVGTAIDLLLFRALLGKPIATTIWADNFDPRLIHWILEWGYQALWAQRELLNFWDANSFFPHAGSLAFSDSLLSLQLFYTPLRVLGFATLPAMYLALAGTVLLGCMLSAWVLSRLCSIRPLALAIVLFAAHGSLSVTNFAGHYQLFGAHFAIPCLLALCGYWIRPGWGMLVVALLGGALAVTCATYLAPMLVVFALGGCLAAGLRWIMFRGSFFGTPPPRGSVLVLHLVLVLTTAAVLYQIQFAPYLTIFGGARSPDWSEHLRYSARPWSIIAHLSSNSLWYRPVASVANSENAYAPGVVLLVLACLGAAWLWVSRASKSPHARTDRSLALAGALIVCVSVLFSLGPRLSGAPSVSMPFEWVSHLLPGLAQVRTPGRFGMFVGVGLALMALPFLREVGSRGRWTGLVVLALLMLESVPSYGTFRLSRGDVPIYRELARVCAPRTPLIELPLAGRDPLGTLGRILAQLDGSTVHWGWLVAGYGGRSTPELDELIALDRAVQRSERAPRELFAFARRVGVRHLLIHVRRYRPAVATRFFKMLQRSSSMRVLSRKKGSVVVAMM